ncbi:hypothetical protein HU200_022072 [Digitaria exilis]|uniref:HMA domain-containing protein n=1 Tax=Digitaria exilis TaxID=1010633 RepID=A0A835EXN0_9POAL|nr:hypothetical protein HU200_022072 [Digitaria exilis]
MVRIKDIITTPFRSCRRWTTAAARKDHATAVAPLVVFSDDGEDAAPHIVLKMHLHCASCAAKIERVVMDIPGVEKVATDVEESRVTVTGTADAAAVATSVQVRTRKPVTVVRDGRSAAREQSVATVRASREDQAHVGGNFASVDAGVAGWPQADEWTAEVRIAGLQCGSFTVVRRPLPTSASPITLPALGVVNRPLPDRLPSCPD